MREDCWNYITTEHQELGVSVYLHQFLFGIERKESNLNLYCDIWLF